MQLKGPNICKRAPLKCVHKKKFIGYKLIFDSTFLGGGNTVWVIIYLFSNTKVGGAGICLAQKQSLGTKAPFFIVLNQILFWEIRHNMKYAV